MKKHCQIGEHILTPVMDDEKLMQIVRNHHERFDGKGYPDGLAGEEIPLGAAILSVCDTFDAMTSERSYRAPLKVSDAFAELERCKGTQFNPKVVEAFLKASNTFAQMAIRNA
jgi:HD-GYP domain-containing protein (c-di-GMP phosphodiesterase class II)